MDVTSSPLIPALVAGACGATAALACCGSQRAPPPARQPPPLPPSSPIGQRGRRPDAFEFAGKVCLVTGGAMGIGRAIVEEFANRGATVVYADLVRCLEDGATTTTAGELVTRARLASGSFSGANVSWVQCDVTDAAQVGAAVEETLQRCGRIDVLVNNAGICPDESCKPAHELAVEQYDKVCENDEFVLKTRNFVLKTRNCAFKTMQVMAVNSRSYFLFAKHVIGKAFLPQGGGVVVNMASVQGLQSVPGVPAYATSKGAVISFTRNLAVEYAHKNIRVNAINPGSIRTPMLMHFLGDDAEKTDPTPMKRWGKPEEIAAATCFLASDQSSYCELQSKYQLPF